MFFEFLIIEETGLSSILSIVGARPQFVKAAVVSRALQQCGLDEHLVHTGQHYDEELSGCFIEQLGIKNVVVNLAAGSGTHANQTARMMVAIGEYLDRLDTLPKLLLVYGDTNSTVAASLVGAKLGIKIAHVEAGLRSYNREMPEEVNRVITDHLSKIHFCSSANGIANLAREGISGQVINVGDVMLDAYLTFKGEATAHGQHIVSDLAEGSSFILSTIHRPSNTDDPNRLEQILDALARLALPVVWPVHPRTRSKLGENIVPANVMLQPPASYFEMLGLLQHCTAVVTDSGGLQKEAYWAKKKCITLRSETEWVETLDGGWNSLKEPRSLSGPNDVFEKPTTPWRQLYGNGKASERIAQALLIELN
ncbi:MAG: non-hydrolyzing UDP-N-acetylglucosamine 2-epimerase [Alphaproteobacteria bacterium]